ncbi:hypothetical protein [Dactylosporangium sp. NPDC051484]|uniref:hypothetical protein n=1 Tax=Dactylosporangium sp. NPDC051484 TaxID=3154942 RepID=UPI00344BF908
MALPGRFTDEVTQRSGDDVPMRSDDPVLEAIAGVTIGRSGTRPLDETSAMRSTA